MKVFNVFLVIVFLFISLIAVLVNFDNDEEYFSYMIVGNSYSESDMYLSSQIENQVIDFLYPYVAECYTYKDAVNMLNEKLIIINTIIDNCIKSYNCNYNFECVLKSVNLENINSDYDIEDGNYFSLYIAIGNAESLYSVDFIFPPLKFVNNFSNSLQYIIYKSKLLEIINKYC